MKNSLLIVFFYVLFINSLFSQIDEAARFDIGLSYVDRFTDENYIGASWDFGISLNDYETQDFDFGIMLHFQQLYMPDYVYTESGFQSNFRASINTSLSLIPIELKYGILSLRAYFAGSFDSHWDFQPNAETSFLVRWQDRLFTVFMRSGLDLWKSEQVHWVNRVGVHVNLFELNRIFIDKMGY
jgi:hypothetical protein